MSIHQVVYRGDPEECELAMEKNPITTVICLIYQQI
jgi:hypothetical protein